jgi:hypothetical protein
LIDAEVVERIRAFERRDSHSVRLRWPAIVALVFGGLMLGAGVLLFVAAHWDTLSPSARFALVVVMVAAFHIAGALAANRTQALAATLHGVGTVSLGAGIYLSGQIFNMNEHWPTAILLWAAGAAIAWWLLRDWVQFAIFALLAPLWLAGEWTERIPRIGGDAFRVLGEGTLLVAITYFTARTRNRDGANRRVLVWLGAFAILPCAVALALENEIWRNYGYQSPAPIAAGYWCALGVPLAAAALLRGREAWMNGVAAIWVVLLGLIGMTPNPGLYLWCAVGAAGLVAWGVHEGRSERVNMGMAGFALTLLFFYFSQVMDKLNRSASLIALGVLFLAGGWALEKMRRRFVAQAREAA